MPAYIATVQISIIADSLEEATDEAERFAFRNDGGSLMHIEEVEDGAVPSNDGLREQLNDEGL